MTASTKPEASAQLVKTSDACTTWEVNVPMPSGKSTRTTKLYHATTYPDSDLIFLQSGVRGRAIPSTAATRLLPLVRAAIQKAQAATQPTGDTQ
jgi:hypothetical protein